MTEPISLREAARRLGVHYMTAYRYVRTGRLPARQSGQEWLIDPGDLPTVRKQAASGPGRRARRDWVPILMARLTAGDEAGAWRVIEEAPTAGRCWRPWSAWPHAAPARVNRGRPPAILLDSALPARDLRTYRL
jgi:excisionase family DNA binding protein